MKLSLVVIAKVDMPEMIKVFASQHQNVHVQEPLAHQELPPTVALSVEEMKFIRNVAQQQLVKTLVTIQTFQLIADVHALLVVFVLMDMFEIVKTDVY
jgi:hypothetical protein